MRPPIVPQDRCAEQAREAREAAGLATTSPRDRVVLLATAVAYERLSARGDGAQGGAPIVASYAQHPLLDVERRRRLFECVEENQGAHLRELARRAAMPLGTALYHLQRLESSGLVVARADGRYKRYFAGHSLGLEEKDMLSAFRHDVPRRIALALLEVGEATQRQLCVRLGVSRSTLSFQVNQLVARGIVRAELAHPERVYALANVEQVERLLHAHAASLERTARPPRGPIAAAVAIRTLASPERAAAGGE